MKKEIIKTKYNGEKKSKMKFDSFSISLLGFSIEKLFLMIENAKNKEKKSKKTVEKLIVFTNSICLS